MNLIPAPYEFKQGVGSFRINGELTVGSELDLPLIKLKKSNNPDITVKKADLPKEAYRLTVERDGIEILAADKIGAYYAFQSLRQLSRAELGGKSIDCCEIYDKPRFSFRGLQLDESRHFFGTDAVKKLIDTMFMMKLNVFHWHLTDDQGWRIEIKKYPLLTEIGSKRKNTQVGGWGSRKMIEGEYGGYYTQEEIKEIVEYADERGIMIIPEIDFPAHCAAAIAAYPWLACRELDREVPGYFGGIVPETVLGIRDWNRTICVGKDDTVNFVFDIIDEVCELFPAPYFHIGGDEAPKNEWKKCPHCQKVIKDNGLKNEEDLQGMFNNAVLEHLKAKGKRLIGWNEILKAGNLDKSAVVQYWTPQRDKRAEDFVNSGGSMIMSNHHSFYFDMTYSQYPLKFTYDYKPEKFGVSTENVKNVLGVEGENWTEWIDSVEVLDCRLHPRMEALAEVAWSEERNKNWHSFKKRLDAFKPYFDYLGINYAVDEVSLPKNLIRRGKIRKLFFKGDTHYEVKLNKEYKSKGAR